MHASAGGRADAPEPGRLGEPAALVTEDGRHGHLGHGHLGHGQLGQLGRLGGQGRRGRPGRHGGGAGESGSPGGEPSRAGLLDSLARHVRTRPHDTGLHLLIGGGPDRGRGVGAALVRAVADLVLRQRPRCERVPAEPDVRNIASVPAFLSAGFRLSEEAGVPEKRAALPVRDRATREQF